MMRVRVWGCALLATAALVFASSVGGWPHGGSAAGAATVALTPPSQVVHVGENVTVDVSLSDVTDMAAWEVMIKYDPSILSFTGFQPTDWLASTGRTPQCPGAVVDTNIGTARFGCVTFGQEPPAGVAGSGVVAHATFAANATGTSNLELVSVGYAIPEGSGAPVGGTYEGAVKVIEPGDSDPQDTSLPPTPTPNPVKLTPTARPGGGTDDDLRLPGTSGTPGAGQTPPAGTIGGGTTGSGARGGAGAGSSGAGSVFGQSSSGSAGGAAGGTGAPHAGQGTVRTEHSLLVRVGAGVLAAAGLACLAAAGLERRRRRAE